MPGDNARERHGACGGQRPNLHNKKSLRRGGFAIFVCVLVNADLPSGYAECAFGSENVVAVANAFERSGVNACAQVSAVERFDEIAVQVEEVDACHSGDGEGDGKIFSV